MILCSGCKDSANQQAEKVSYRGYNVKRLLSKVSNDGTVKASYETKNGTNFLVYQFNTDKYAVKMYFPSDSGKNSKPRGTILVSHDGKQNLGRSPAFSRNLLNSIIDGPKK